MRSAKKFVNLTPHPISIHLGNLVMDIPPSGTVARVITLRNPSSPLRLTPENGMVFWIPVVVQVLSTTITGLPEPQDGVAYLVSLPVLEVLRKSGLSGDANLREDVFAPDTGPEGAVRDAQGKILGVKGLIW